MTHCGLGVMPVSSLFMLPCVFYNGISLCVWCLCAPPCPGAWVCSVFSPNPFSRLYSLFYSKHVLCCVVLCCVCSVFYFTTFELQHSLRVETLCKYFLAVFKSYWPPPCGKLRLWQLTLGNKVYVYETCTITHKNAIKFTFKRGKVFPKSEIREELITWLIIINVYPHRKSNQPDFCHLIL